ncbi:hypothetical protein PL373_18910 [Tenacibaculum maritimum]|nr:hypothetical protein [Tenacibaculum maritimum]MDB0603159.1 hypothetical protein [Tenacibaculum maritimum]MDB0610422.1 hypothetical protein [Tenacibaculum maritimum]
MKNKYEWSFDVDFSFWAFPIACQFESDKLLIGILFFQIQLEISLTEK